MTPVLHTERLVLRAFRDDDLDALEAINTDAKVMEYFDAPRDRFMTQDMIDRTHKDWVRDGYAFGAIEMHGQCIGMCGLSNFSDDAPFAPAVEIGWRLAHAHWGKGIAFEAASAWLNYGFHTLGLDEIVAFTPHKNARSYRLMERLGMTRGADFTFPKLPADDRLQPFRFYRIQDG